MTEIDLLILCGRKTFGSRQAALLERALDQRLDWTLILNQAQRHCVLPFLYVNLSSHGLMSRVPPEVRDALDANVRGIAARNLALIGELARILHGLQQAGISAIPFKGPVAAAIAYGDESLRAFADLDILIDPKDLQRARSVLEGRGYRPALTLTPRQERAYLKAECALQLCRPSENFVVELHWRFFERNASLDLPAPKLRERCMRLSIAGMTVPSLAVEDLILYLSAHGAKHCWERLEWISCVAEIIERHPSLDWQSIFDRARQYRMLRILHLGLWLANVVSGVALPEHVANSVRLDRGAKELGQLAVKWLFVQREGTHYENRAARYRFVLRMRERGVDRLRILFFSVFKPPHPEASEWIAAPLKFAFLNSALRPIRLLSEFGAVAWRRCFGDPRKRTQRSNAAMFAAAIVLALAVLSLLPEPLKGRMATSGLLHESAHLAAFFVAFLFIARLAPRSIARAAGLGIGLVAFGALTELLQSKIYGNYLEYWDIRADALGVALGFMYREFAVWIAGIATVPRSAADGKKSSQSGSALE